ncbi:SWIM zinc finger family protein [Stagnihabitans tardus]|uniref:SWIM-type domain-containing protein n=1 Tax=Stagnihabitans tardus TaxID=2699202 RepID=A0AAE4YB39_9RHOB|nr:SWIM zinc finger family protein [Stagnihabitans tardus]NBZ86385.1 hypothetical protein [Stagnihabitans tardus]
MSWIAACSDEVLAAAASKGLVLRAAKDVEAGRVEGSQVEGQTVTLGASLAASRCTCPAVGLCRHILAVVIQERGRAGQEAQEAGEPEALPDLEELRAFAGADWAEAVELARKGGVLAGQTVMLAPGDSVTFPRGRPLKEAVHKGPRRARLAIVAAGLVRAGHPLPEAAEVAPEPLVTLSMLDAVQEALAAATLALAAGNLALARDRLFTMALAARIEATPRLASDLRSLAARLDPDAMRQAGFTPTEALAALARAHALAEALRRFPDDPALTGTLSRRFTGQGPREMGFVGVETWRNASGARGVSFYLVDLGSGQVHQATDARGAGGEPGFSPETALRQTLWGLGDGLGLMGKRLHFPDAALAPDGGLALSQRAELRGGLAPEALSPLSDWSGLGALLRAGRGAGLRRRAGPIAVLLAPKHCETPAFDPFSQETHMAVSDGAHGLDLTLPQGLNGQESRIAAVLVALESATRGRLLSVWIKGHAAPFAMGHQPLPILAGWRALLTRVLRPVVAPPEADRGIALLAGRATERALVQLSAPGTEFSPDLVAEAEARGLALAARLMRACDGGTGPALRLVAALETLGELD